jgi:DNA-binding transcriptional LysR family regulator
MKFIIVILVIISMNISRVDLNLLVYLDVLLREQSVTKAAEQLSITQPAMSNGLKRLRELFNDPLLVRTSDGMTPTQRAAQLQPVIRDVLSKLETTIAPQTEFDPELSDRCFRIMASDYAETTLLVEVIKELRVKAPFLSLDVITPSDVTFHDVEHGKVDMAINRFEELPQSFHQKVIWNDQFSCLVNKNNVPESGMTLEHYLSCKHVWVSKTGFGVGVGIDPNEVQKLGWVDAELDKFGKRRDISVFTRHYHVAMWLAKQQDLVVTLPHKAALHYSNDPDMVILNPPFDIPDIELKVAWSPLLHNDAGHIWLRRLISEVAERIAPRS